MSISEPVILFGEYSLDLARGCLLRSGQPVHLRPQAFRALKFFAERRGRLVTKEELIQEIWEGRAVTDDTLVQCLRDVRHALGQDGSRHLTTRRGLGYIFEVEVTTRTWSLARGNRRAAAVVAAVASVLLVASAILYVLRQPDTDRQLNSVAVLPFPSPGTIHHATNQDAYRHYVSGVFQHARGRPEHVRSAIEDFNRSIASDPKFALAWTGLAVANLSLADSLSHPDDVLAKARSSASRAVELDSSLPEPHITLGHINASEWNWDEAEREYRRALELSPNSTRAHIALATHFAITGRSVEALHVVARIRRLDPLNIRLIANEGRVLYLARRFDDAIEQLQRSAESGNAPSLFWLAAAYDAKQLHQLAAQQYEALIDRLGDSPSNQVFLGYALAKRGERRQAETILKRLEATAEYISPAELAVLYVGLGDRNSALSALERAYAQRDLQLQWLKVEHHYDELREDPRFRSLEERIGLSRYNDQSSAPQGS